MTQENCPECGSPFKESHSPRNACGEIRYTKRWFICGSTETTETDGRIFFKQSSQCKLAALRSQLQQTTEERDELKQSYLSAVDERVATEQTLDKTFVAIESKLPEIKGTMEAVVARAEAAESELARVREELEQLAIEPAVRCSSGVTSQSLLAAIAAILSPPAANESEVGDGK